jgi:hypothetical protein
LTTYPWYIEPPLMILWTPYPWYFYHLPMVYRTGVQNTMDTGFKTRWIRGQYTMGKGV